jgi:hypothetical protein
MNARAIEAQARNLLAQHGLAARGWRFEWDRAKRRFGKCSYRHGVISLSAPLTQLNPDHVTDTLLHEIAHALVGPGYGHGRVWQRKARELGARPVRCGGTTIAGEAKRIPGQWFGRCPNCAKEHQRYKRPGKTRHACKRCCVQFNGGRYSEAYALVWERREGGQ